MKHPWMFTLHSTLPQDMRKNYEFLGVSSYAPTKSASASLFCPKESLDNCFVFFAVSIK